MLYPVLFTGLDLTDFSFPTTRARTRRSSDDGRSELDETAHHYIGFVKFSDRRHFPEVDVAAEKGSGLETVVGAAVPGLTAGSVVDPATGSRSPATPGSTTSPCPPIRGSCGG